MKKGTRNKSDSILSFNKLVFLLSILISFFFFFLFLNSYLFNLDFIIIGVFQELLTIPFMIGELLLLICSIIGFAYDKFLLKSYAFSSIILLIVNIILEWVPLIKSITS